MIEISKGRFVVAKRIVAANIYVKESKIRVAITLDTINKEEQTAFSREMANENEAQAFIMSLAN